MYTRQGLFYVNGCVDSRFHLKNYKDVLKTYIDIPEHFPWKPKEFQYGKKTVVYSYCP